MNKVLFNNWMLSLLLVGVLLPVAVNTVIQAFVPDWKWNCLPFHSVVELLGSLAGVAVATLLLLLQKERSVPGYYFLVSGALIIMGVLDGFHAAVGMGQSFVWLHSTAILFAGILFAFVWLPARIIEARRVDWLPWIVVSAAVIFSLASIVLQDALPLMVRGGEFTPGAKAINFGGGFFFLAAAVSFIIRYKSNQRLEDFLFANFCLLNCWAGLLFPWSLPWRIDWWFWHLLRLAAYFIILSYLVVTFTRLKDEHRKTLQRLEEERLWESEGRFHGAFENAAIGMALVELDGKWLRVNRSLCESVGYSEQELLESDFQTITHPDDLAADLALVQQVLSGKMSSYHIEKRYIHKKGHIVWIFWSVTLVRDLSGKPLYFISEIQDISARKLAEEKLRGYAETLEQRVLERTKQIEEANNELQLLNEELKVQQQELVLLNRRLEEVSQAKSDFLANMSHELRTPLNSIIGFSEVLQDQMFGPLGDKQKEYVGYILASGQHLLTLINDILDLAKVESGKMELELSCFSLKEMLESSLTIVREKAMKHGISLRLELHPEADCEVMADQRKLKQILYNLLSNAVKFTPDGGAVTVAAVKLPPDAKGGEFLEISVHDTGIGIREEDMPRLFQAFSQLESPYSKKYEGTGLGLSLTRRLVVLHGGVIRVESRVGEGSRFIFTLPVEARQRQAEAEFPVEPPPMVLPGSARILLIEDDALARAAMASVLSSRGYQVTAASGGAEGIAAALADPPSLIILDLLMPDLSGFEVAERLRAEEVTSKVPIMVLTSMALSSFERQRLEGKVWRIAEKGNLSTQAFAELVAGALR